MPPHRTVGGAPTTESAPVTSPGEEGPTITAVLQDGPIRGTRIEVQVVQGRPPSTIDAPADDAGACRYCLAEWAQSGPSAVYTFLYRV